jgi:hypothetical protein
LDERIVSRTDENPPLTPDVPRKRLWPWLLPLGIAAAGVGTVAALLLRGCWHTHMSWPMRHDEEFSYRVCTDCGIIRLFDPVAFRSYGPYGHDLQDLIARERARRQRQEKKRSA